MYLKGTLIYVLMWRLLMGAKEDVKIALIRSGKTMSDLVRLLNEKHGRDDTVQNLSNKLRRKSLRYNEALEIAEALGYEIQWISKK